MRGDEHPTGVTGNDHDPENGLIGLMAATAVLVVAVWVTLFSLADTLARSHAVARAHDVAGQVERVVRAMPPAQAGAELNRLMRYMHVRRLAVTNGEGRTVWASDATARQAALAKGPRIGWREVNAEGVRGLWLRLQKTLTGGRRLLLQFDVTPSLTRYRAVARLIAEALTLIVLLGFFVAAAILFGRYRERLQARDALDRLRRENEREQRRIRDLQRQLDEINGQLASLTGRLAETMHQGIGPAADMPPGKARHTG
ncbi:MAG TPA: hypothetical protein ENK15_09285 [Thermopetrobacter sp.]|nr:hypothetical protein [Thermopetrobacter sp.]